jgi:PAS domain S-box-containing protein
MDKDKIHEDSTILNHTIDELRKVIDHLKLNEEKLLRKEKLYMSMIENVSSGIALIDQTGKFTLYNNEFLRMFGLSDKSGIKNVNDQNWSEWQVFNEDLVLLDVDEHPVRKAAISGKKVSDQLVGVRLPDGERITWMLISAEPVFGSDGKIEMFICTYTDITELKLANVALLERENELKELNATKDKFFSIIAHDLRSPITSIIGCSELLSDKIKDKEYEYIDELAAVIQRSSWLAMNLLTNLFEWSRFQTGRIEFKPKEMDIIPVIDEALELHNASTTQKSIFVERKVPESFNIFADRHMIATVMRNLINNAVKFTPEGGKISISVIPQDGRLLVEVSDNGTGMKPEALDRLFRVDTAFSTRGTAGEEGTGLGLLICREFVAKNGGTIRAESEYGKGSRFSFTVPVRSNDARV